MHRTNSEQHSPANAAPPPLHPHLAAVWGAFLHEGMMLTSKNTERTFRLLDLWGNGSIELINSICEYIPALWEEVQPYWHKPEAFSGVFEYEVVSILGEELATHMLAHEGNLPSDGECRARAAELVGTFFSQRGPSQGGGTGATRPWPAALARLRAWAGGLLGTT